MRLISDIVSEIEVLSLFNADSMREGIKLRHNAEVDHITAMERLHAKGLVTQKDGGYLTSLGMDAVTHTEQLMIILGGQ